MRVWLSIRRVRVVELVDVELRRRDWMARAIVSLPTAGKPLRKIMQLGRGRSMRGDGDGGEAVGRTGSWCGMGSVLAS